MSVNGFPSDNCPSGLSHLSTISHHLLCMHCDERHAYRCGRRSHAQVQGIVGWRGCSSQMCVTLCTWQLSDGCYFHFCALFLCFYFSLSLFLSVSFSVSLSHLSRYEFMMYVCHALCLRPDTVPDDPRRVIVESFTLMFDGGHSITFDPNDKKLLEKPFKIKEGSTYRIKMKFYTQHEIVSGLVYLNLVYKHGIRGTLPRAASKFILVVRSVCPISHL